MISRAIFYHFVVLVRLVLCPSRVFWKTSAFISSKVKEKYLEGTCKHTKSTKIGMYQNFSIGKYLLRVIK